MSYSRPSVPSSLSHLLPAQHDLTPSQLRLLEKQQEYASLQALREASGNMLARVEELARMSNVMADGGAAVGSVLRNWPHVFSILNLFEKSSEPNPEPVEDDPEEVPEQEPLPQLVRLGYDKYQSQDQEGSSEVGGK